VELRDLWGDAADALAERLGPRSPVAARIAALEQALIARGDRLDPDPVAATAVSWLARDPGARVDRIARRLGMSARQLHRRFTAAVGYGPKTFQRIARFQRLLELARRPHRAEGLSQLAADAGYADQAHMTREVGALSGRTPSALLGQVPSTLAMADLFDGEAAPLAPFTETTPRRP
jgi:AraC-like DNA-binding protein